MPARSSHARARPIELEERSMIIAAIFVLGLLSARLAGGELRRLGHVRLRGTGAAIGALLVQIVVITIAPGGDAGIHAALHLSTYAVAGWFVWVNRKVPWFRLVAVGGVLNVAAIVANGGVMPASRSALVEAGLLPTNGDFYNSTVLSHPRLSFLGDVFALPSSWPLANVFSLGDVLIVVAGLLALHDLADSRLAFRASRSPVATDGLGRLLDRAAGRRWDPAYCDLRSVVSQALGVDGDFYTAEIEPNWDRADRGRRIERTRSFRSLADEARGADVPPPLQALLATKAGVLQWASARAYPDCFGRSSV
jgi:hypothetical protein